MRFARRITWRSGPSSADAGLTDYQSLTQRQLISNLDGVGWNSRSPAYVLKRHNQGRASTSERRLSPTGLEGSRGTGWSPVGSQRPLPEKKHGSSSGSRRGHGRVRSSHGAVPA